MVLIGGLLRRTAAAMPLDQVTGLTLQRTVVGRLLGYGTLIVISPSRRQAFRKVKEIARLRGFLRTVNDLRGRQGRVYPLEYLLALPLIAGMAGDGELDAAAEWAATAPEELLLKLGAPLDTTGKPRRPDATTIGRGLVGCDQGQYDDALCAWSAARARALRPGMRGHLRIDGKAVRGAARGGRVPMLLSGVWDDGTTAAQLPVDVKKTNEIPVFRQLLTKIPDLARAVITADQMHTQRKHARQIEAAGAFFVFTIGENQPRLFEAAGALPWESVAGDAWTVDRGHGRIDVRTIKTLPPTPRIRELFPHVEQVFLVERYSYGTDGELLGAVAVLGITSLPADQAGPADLLAYLRGHWSIEMHHYVRDVCLGEDASRIGRAHRAMAAVRNKYLPYPEQLYLEISGLLRPEEQGGSISQQGGGEEVTVQDSSGPSQQE